jgi:hypothetical protein
MKITKLILFQLDIKTTDDVSQKNLIEDFNTQNVQTFIAKPLANKIHENIIAKVNDALLGYEQPNKLSFIGKLSINGRTNELMIIFDYSGNELSDEQAESLNLVTQCLADELIKDYSYDFDYKVFGLKQFTGTVKTSKIKIIY